MKQAHGQAADTNENIVDDCWNKIGVQGDLTCQELAQHIHCRNCPAYTAAAAALLGRSMPDSYVHERTSYFAQQKQNKGHETHSMTIFRIGVEWLALPTSALVEITELRPIHSLPHRKGGVVSGLVNVRGELLICVSLGELLGLEPATEVRQLARQEVTQTVYARLLVIQGDGGRLVFRVDEMHGIHRYHPNELLPVPSTIAKAAAPYATAMLSLKNRTVGCLDAALVLYTLQRSLS